ncbi:MAG: hypothetical protein A3G34_02520 [Candidatus Lindowbacteria bacterium RIFCSPLOWO2_12_FULL_62_27]|nr:MAG: hypothetical protein A3G34_02520 [Candidatus Lindowbacteria bacterium RIFCSPLOWO2_12_FULL_62_27]
MKTLDFRKGGGLIPAIAQDARTGDVLMLAYMNRESLKRTLATGYAHYYSRSRQEQWKKGETSGHVQRVREIRVDCDRDTLLLKVDQTGPACHTGRANCFFRPVGKTRAGQDRGGSNGLGVILNRLFLTIDDRLRRRPRGSYTVKLTRPNRKKNKTGLDKVLEKIGEEATEVILAAVRKPKSYVVSEVSDLMFHLMVMLRLRGLTPDEIARELERRERE